MDREVQKAYDLLVPGDQLVVDAMIATLVKKDREIAELIESVRKGCRISPPPDVV